MIRISEYLDRLNDEELKALVGSIVLYKRKRNKYIEALKKENISTITMNDAGKMVLRTTNVSAFVEAGDLELDFLRQLIKEFKTSEKAFEKFQELIEITWKGWLPPYTFSVSGSYYNLEWSEEITKDSKYNHNLCSKIELGFDEFLNVLKGDFRK